LLNLSILIGILNRCERDDFPLPDFLKILQHDTLSISADHTNHLINLFLRELLPKAFEKEGDIIERQYSIFIDIYHFECLAYLLIGVELSIDLVAGCIVLVRVFVGDQLLGFICLLLPLCRGLQGLLALGTVYFYRVLDVSLALGLVYQAGLVEDIRNYGEVLLICEKWLRHLYNGLFIIGTVKMVGKHGLDFL